MALQMGLSFLLLPLINRWIRSTYFIYLRFQQYLRIRSSNLKFLNFIWVLLTILCPLIYLYI